MNQRQARALLELIADLYTVANTPETPTVETNHAEKNPETVGAKK